MPHPFLHTRFYPHKLVFDLFLALGKELDLDLPCEEMYLFIKDIDQFFKTLP
jgi:hypothetical protein